MKRIKAKCFLKEHKPVNDIQENLMSQSISCLLKPNEFRGSGDIDGLSDNRGYVSGIKTPTFICGHHCLLISLMLDERASLLRDGSVTIELLQHDPNAFVGMLTPKSKQVAEVLLKSGVNLATIDQTCAQCSAQFYQQQLAEGQAQAWKGSREIDKKVHTR